MRSKLIVSAIALGFGVSSGAMAAGALEWKEKQLYPLACAHSGGKAICRFSVVNQGSDGTLPSYHFQEAAFVDDGGVPHKSDLRYFLDGYGNRQDQLFLQKGGRGQYVMEFPEVDLRVKSGRFSFRKQVVGDVAVASSLSQAAATQSPAVPLPTTQPAAQAAQYSAPAPTPAPTMTEQQLQMSYQQCRAQGGVDAVCSAQLKAASAQNGVNNVTSTISQGQETIKSISGTLKGLFGGRKQNDSQGTQQK